MLRFDSTTIIVDSLMLEVEMQSPIENESYSENG